MKKVFVIMLFVCASFAAFTQDCFRGLFAKTYLETAKGNAEKFVRVNKQISIIYNSTFCRFSIEGKDNIFFKIRNYETHLNEPNIQTSFVNEETETTREGFYGVIIFESNKGISFEVSLPSDYTYPNGFTYLIDKAQKYNESGKVEGSLQLDWKAMRQKQQKEDSLILAKQNIKNNQLSKQRYDDSMFVVKRDNTKEAYEDSLNLTGKAQINVDTHLLKDTIEHNIKSAPNQYLVGKLKIHIDAGGYVTKAESIAYNIDDFLLAINKLIIGMKLRSFKAKNGKTYPCYTMMDILLTPQPIAAKKKGFHL